MSSTSICHHMQSSQYLFLWEYILKASCWRYRDRGCRCMASQIRRLMRLGNSRDEKCMNSSLEDNIWSWLGNPWECSCQCHHGMHVDGKKEEHSKNFDVFVWICGSWNYGVPAHLHLGIHNRNRQFCHSLVEDNMWNLK